MNRSFASLNRSWSNYMFMVYYGSCVVLLGLKIQLVVAALPDFSNDYRIEDIASTLPNGSYILQLRLSLEDVPDQCRNDFCPAETISTRERGDFHWPSVSLGYRYVLRCPYAIGPQVIYATRDCNLGTLNGTLEAEWDEPEVYYCPGPPLVEICRGIEEQEADARLYTNFRQWTLDKFRLLSETAERWDDRTLFYDNGLLLARLWEEFVLRSQSFRFPQYLNEALTNEDVRILLDVLDLYFLPNWSLNNLISVKRVFQLGNLLPMPSAVGRVEFTSKTVDYSIVRLLEQSVATSVDQVSTNFTGDYIAVGGSSIHIKVPPSKGFGAPKEVVVIYIYLREMHQQQAERPNLMNRTWIPPVFDTTDMPNLPTSEPPLPLPDALPGDSDSWSGAWLPLIAAGGEGSQSTTNDPNASEDYTRIRERRFIGTNEDQCQPLYPPSTVNHNGNLYATQVETQMIFSEFLGPMAYTEIRHIDSSGGSTPYECKTDVSWDLASFNTQLVSSLTFVMCAVSPEPESIYVHFANREWFLNFCQTILDRTMNTIRCKCQTTGYVALFGRRSAGIVITDPPPPIPPRGYDEVLGFTQVYEVWVTGLVLMCLSAVCLLLTILSYAIFSKTRRGTATTILLNLCVALLLFYSLTILLSFLPLDVSVPGAGCTVSLALTYYLLFVTLMWNAVEGVNLYLKLVRVFNSHFSKFALKAGIVAYVLPAVILAIVLIADHKAFNGHYIDCTFNCSWKPNTLYYAYLLPLCLIMVINMVIFVMVLTVMKKHGPTANQAKKKTYWSRLVGAIAMLFLLGLPWVLSAFGALDGSTNKAVSIIQGVIQVFFVILTGLQGVFIFLFHCARNAEVRSEWSSVLGRSSTQLTSSKKTSSEGYRQKADDLRQQPTNCKENNQQKAVADSPKEELPKDCKDIAIHTDRNSKTNDIDITAF